MSTTYRPKVARYAADTSTDDRAWMPHAMCGAATNPDAWHPNTEFRIDPDNWPTFEICHRCLVRQECLDYALNRPWLTGIWGGTTTDKRHRMRRNRRKKSA